MRCGKTNNARTFKRRLTRNGNQSRQSVFSPKRRGDELTQIHGTLLVFRTYVRRSDIQLFRRLFQVSVASSLLQLACPVRTRPPAAHFAHDRFFYAATYARRVIYTHGHGMSKKASRAPAVKVKMAWNLKKAWYYGRLLVTAAAVGVLGYLLLEDDTKIVESTFKVNGYEAAIPMQISSILPSCYEFENDGLGFKACLYNDNEFNASEINNAGTTKKAYECDDKKISSYWGDADPGETIKFECCDRMQKSHTRLIVGASFLAAALLGSIIAVVSGLGDKNTGWHVIDRLIHAIVYIVATGLLGSALEFSQKNGVLTCNDSFETFLNKVEEEQGMSNVYDTNEDHEEGFWMIVAALAISAVLALVESVIFIVETSHRGGFLVSPKTEEAAFGTETSTNGARVGSLFF